MALADTQVLMVREIPERKGQMKYIRLQGQQQ
jgi:hypothetical protein